MFIIIYLRVEGTSLSYFDSVGGCWTTRTPAIRAGLNDRSQSAYAAPAPKPVERAMGHARPEINLRHFSYLGEAGCHARRKRMTDAMTPTLKPIPLNVRRKKPSGTTEGCDIECLGRTILLVNPPLLPRTRCKLDDNMKGGNGYIQQRSYCGSFRTEFLL